MLLVTSPRDPGDRRAVAIGVLAVNAVGVASATVVWDLRDTDREVASLSLVSALSPLEANFSSWRRSEARRLRDGIRFIAVDRVTCPVPFVLSVAGSLTRQPKLYGVSAPGGWRAALFDPLAPTIAVAAGIVRASWAR